MTAQDIVTAALTLCGRLGPGRTPGPVESAVAFGILQRMIDSWNLQRTYVYEVRVDSYTLTAATGTYSIGTGGTLAGSTRPIFIESANTILTVSGNALRQKLDVINQDAFAEIATQGDQSIRPKVLYDDYAFPASNLYLYPVPQISMSLELYTWQQLQAFVALTDTFSMPPGYFRALKDSLAVEICPTFRQKLTPDLLRVASESKAAIVAKNLGFPDPMSMQQQNPAGGNRQAVSAAAPNPAMPAE